MALLSQTQRADDSLRNQSRNTIRKARQRSKVLAFLYFKIVVEIKCTTIENRIPAAINGIKYISIIMRW
jgi:hypothetical protein